MIVQPGPVVDFLIANQNVRDPYHLDWAKVNFLLCTLLLLLLLLLFLGAKVNFLLCETFLHVFNIY